MDLDSGSENRMLKCKTSGLFPCLLSFASITTIRLPDDTAQDAAAPIRQQAEASTSREKTAAPKTQQAEASTSALPASDQDQDQDQGEAGMLKAEDVARDPTVFTPENRIVFHRSDGDPEYKPPNLIVPDSKEVEINYYHIFNRGEQRWVNWSKTIAQKLATDYFGLEGGNWALKDFPKDYYFTEQRKGPRKTYRTDPYLFGSAAHRFRSTLEFVPHAYWLLCDPTLDPSNCNCIYCSKGRRGGLARPTAGDRVSSKRASKPANRFQMTQVASYRMQRNNYKIRAQNSPKGKTLPGVPLAVLSSKERNAELATVEAKEQGECEGFRVGEIAYCRLNKPIVSEEDETQQIIAWPVLIEATRMIVEVDHGPNGTTATDGQSVSLEGRVKQKRVYDVVFMPTHEKARVDQWQMVPGLMFKMPPSLKKINLGSREDHAWIQSNTAPELNLENGKQRPPFLQVLFVFLYAVESFHNLRLFYTATDQFSRSEMGREAVKHVVFAGPDGSRPEEARKEPEAPWLTGSNSAPASDPVTVTNPERRIDNGGANRFLQVTQQNNYMDLDSDEKSSRRRAPLRISFVNSTAAVPIVSAPALDTNTYWQGILLGLERIWVGDLARLRLSKEDVEIMMASLAKGNDLFNAEDRVKPDLTSPYLLRIKAIYRIAKAEVEQTDDKIRVAGDVFRVVPIDKATSPEVQPQANGVKQEDGTVASPPKKKTKRPTFEIPFRPFLDKAYESQLPMSPMLPEGFGYQRVNQASVEVVCSVQQLAGRLWCSYALPGDDQLAKVEAEKAYLGHEDSKDPTRIRLSLATMIPGAVKAMEVHPNEGLFLNRDRAIAQACKLALESRLKSLDRSSERDRHSDSVMEQEGNEAEEENEFDAGAQHPPAKKARLGNSESTTNGDNITTAKFETVESSAPLGPRQSVSSVEIPAKAASAVTEASTRSDSPPLPENWIKKASRSGQGTYFANLKTKETSWTRPTV